MNVIELRGIGKTFTDRSEPTVALHDINLTIAPGEFIAIIGPSGSGKSTLMNLLGLLDSPSEGEYLLDGDTVSGLRDRKLARIRRDKIGFVFQSFNLLPRLSVLGNVELPLIYAGIRGRKRRTRGLELLKLVGLEDRAGYRPNQISGGQTQRVAIARALANEPSLILADEPTGNLDTKSSDAIIEELRRLNRETGATIVIVTHNPDIAALTDRTVTVRDGAILSDANNQSHRVARPAPAASPASTPTTAPHSAQVSAQDDAPDKADVVSDVDSEGETHSVRQLEGVSSAAEPAIPVTAEPPRPKPRATKSNHIIDLRHDQDDHGDHDQ